MSASSDAAVQQRLQSNLTAIQQRISDACLRSGRAHDSVRLVAVTKYTPIRIVHNLLSLGQTQLGESRPQQLIERAEQLRPDAEIEWHLIGQLQRNKVRAVLPFISMIHSVDSVRLLERIGLIAGELHLRPRVLLQVNVSGESSKSGFSAQELKNAWPNVIKTSNVELSGLMTMAPRTDEDAEIRSTFRGLRMLREELQDISPDVQLRELSMGMSGDFEIAIEEGATLIRLGSILFQGCQDGD